jgi:hypothetical protein
MIYGAAAAARDAQAGIRSEIEGSLENSSVAVYKQEHFSAR